MWKDFFRKPRQPKQLNEYREVSTILERELKLSKEQADRIKDLRSDFFEKEKELSTSIRSERDSINLFMFNKNDNAELIKSLARRVADHDYKMELLRFEQAQAFKAICTPEQLQKFEGLVKEIRDYFRQDNQPQKR